MSLCTLFSGSVREGILCEGKGLALVCLLDKWETQNKLYLEDENVKLEIFTCKVLHLFLFLFNTNCKVYYIEYI